MSDKEFQEPSRANSRWKETNVNKILTPNKGGIFRWKRMPPCNIPDEDQNKEKRHKIAIVRKRNAVIDTINLTDDESEDISKQYQSTSSSTEPLMVFDIDSDEESPVKKMDKELPIHTKINEAIGTIGKWKKDYEPRVETPLPAGMPPMIAGIPVKFPVSPYKSQISVMNAVIKGCKNQEHCLLESPTGSGKTLALLCAALAWQSSALANLKVEEIKKSKNADLDGSTSADSCQPGKTYDSEFDMDNFEESGGKGAKNGRLPQIFYGSRTHKQIEQVIREFKKTGYSQQPMTILGSREHTCIQDPIKGMSKTQLCNELLDTSKKTQKFCVYYKDEKKTFMSTNIALQSLGFETPWDIEDLVELGREHSACPYFAARGLMKEANIIFCPYNYLIDPTIRDSMQIKLEGNVVIFDEAHNIESICRDVGSAEFREDDLSEAMDDCQLVYNYTNDALYSGLVSYLAAIIQIMQEHRLPEPNGNEEVSSKCWTGNETWSLFEVNELAGEQYTTFYYRCKKAISAYKEMKEDIRRKQEMGEDDDTKDGKKKKKSEEMVVQYATQKMLEKLIMALDCIKHPEYSQDYRCAITQQFYYDARTKASENTWTKSHGGKHLRTFKFMCMNPAVIFRGVAKATRCVILASGTLSPTSTFESELGVKFVHKLHANHVISKDQVYVRGIASGPKGIVLRATYKFVHTLPFKDDLGRLLVNVCKTVPHGILCFFSSYSMMTAQIERWQETDVWMELQSCKHIVREPRSNSDLDEVMSEFRGVIRDTGLKPTCGITGALLLAVFRGKVAEGIDFSDNEARCVLTVGIPFAVQNDVVIKLKREYNDLHQKRGLMSGSEWYTVQAYRALNQALGRCIRHRHDWGAILLVDERLLSKSCISYLPKWIREMKLEGDNYDLKDELKLFVKRQLINDQERASK